MLIIAIVICAEELNPMTNQTQGAVKESSMNSKEMKAFEEAATATWQVVLQDACTGDWRQKWFLDGEGEVGLL